MAVAFVGIGAETTGALAGATAVPAGSNGDLLIMFFHSDSGGTGALTGWTAQQASLSSHTVGILWRIRDGTEGSTVTPTGLAGGYVETIIAAWSGSDTTTPINVFASVAANTTSPSITTSVANCWDVTAASFDGGSTSSAAPGSYVRRLNGSGGSYNFYIADLALTTATSYTGTSFAGNGGAPANIIRFAIAPAAGGGGASSTPPPRIYSQAVTRASRW